MSKTATSKKKNIIMRKINILKRNFRHPFSMDLLEHWAKFLMFC